MNIFPFHGRHSEQIGMPFYALWSDNVAQEALFCNLKGSVSHCKRACFEAQGKLFCNALVIRLLRSSHLASFFCAFSAIHSSSNYILSSHLAEYIYTIRQCARPYRSFCLAWQQHRKSYSFNKKKTLFRFSFSIKKMYLCVLNKTRTIYIVQKNK